MKKVFNVLGNEGDGWNVVSTHSTEIEAISALKINEQDIPNVEFKLDVTDLNNTNTTDSTSPVEVTKGNKLVVSNFKTIKDKSSPNYGIKRDSVEWEFKLYESDDTKINVIVNDALEKYGKSLVAKHVDDWEYKPGISDVTVQGLVDQIQTETTRTRAITQETLKALAKMYRNEAHLIGKLPAAAEGGAKAIEAKFSTVLGNVKALEVLYEAINDLAQIVYDDRELNDKYINEGMTANAVLAFIKSAINNAQEAQTAEY